MRRWVLYIVCLVLTACAVGGSDNEGSTDAGSGTKLTIVTYNTHMMDYCKKADSNGIICYLKDHPADVVCLQEVELRKKSWNLTMAALKQSLPEYKYTYFDFKIYNTSRQYGNVVLSRYPLINKKTVPYESHTNISSRCDIVAGSDTIRLITNHLESNQILQTDWADTLSTEAVRSSAEQIGRKLRSAGARRREQAKVVRHEIQASPYPVLVVGDFNSTIFSPTYWLILTAKDMWLHDCYREGGNSGLGATYYLPRHVGIRIDYILCSNPLKPLESHVDYAPTGSDHFPLWATVVIR